MKRIIFISMLVLITSGMVFSQTTPRRPVARSPRPGTESEADRAFRQLREIEVRQTKDTENTAIHAAYRKPTKEEIEILKPAPEHVTKYGEFLRLDNTGIFKLNAYAKCANNGEVVSADDVCMKYTMPGGGTAYSFRYGSYRIHRLSDLILKNDVLKSDGVLQQGIMVDLGKVPIENITLKSTGFKYLVNFKPAETLLDLQGMDRTFLTGVEADGFLYRLGFYAKLGHTFGLRSVAFQRASKISPDGSTFDEFRFDKRHDIVVAFKVIEVDNAGNVTVVWRELSRRDAPALKLEGQG